METKFPLPAKFKIWGWFLFIIGLCLGMAFMLDLPNFGHPDFDVTVLELEISFNSTADKIIDVSLTDNDIYDEILSIIIIIGGLLVSFSREKDEDELTSKIRSESLIWAIIFNYSILLFTIIFIYDDFFIVMIYGMFTPLIFFIFRFHWLLWRSRKSVKYEE